LLVMAVLPVMVALSEPLALGIIGLVGIAISAGLGAAATIISARARTEANEANEVAVEQTTTTSNGNSKRDPGGTIRDLILITLGEVRDLKGRVKVLEKECQHPHLTATRKTGGDIEYRCGVCGHLILVSGMY
jgi:hypothetical protein